MKLKIYILFGVSLCYLKVQAQNGTTDHIAPTLQAGLSGLSFTKGDLDAQLIMEIIAEKQEEVKLKVVQNMLLGRLNESGATIYVFADNIVKNILREQDTELRTRKLIESTVNLTFTAAFTKYILSLNMPNVKRLAETFKINAGDEDKSPSQLKSALREDKITFGGKDLFEDKKALEFFTLLLDLSSEVVRKNIRLKELGLANLAYEGSYFNLNKYLNLGIANGLPTTLPTSTDIAAAINDKEKDEEKYQEKMEAYRFLLTKEIFKDVEKKLNDLVDFIGVIKYAYDSKALLLDKSNLVEFVPENFKSQLNPILGDSITDYLSKEIPTTFQTSINETILQLKGVPWSSLLSNPNLAVTKSVKKLNEYLLELQLLKSLKIETPSLPKTYSEILYHLTNEVIPETKKLAYLDTHIANASLTLERATQHLFGDLVATVDKKLLLKLNESVFLKLLSQVYQFDKLRTFSDYIDFLSEVGDLVPSDRVHATISTVNSFIQEFTTIKTDTTGKEAIDFNVESFLVKIKDMKGDRWSPFEFHLTVGVNTANFYRKPISISETESIYNYSFVSEKIGLKFKLSDFKYTRSHNKGETFRYFGTTYKRASPPREPIISNIHLIAYGSGLLYNIANVGSTKNFNSPLFGIGTGITFFNGLDFNVSWGIPLLKSKPLKEGLGYSFLNLGFDIQFTEYFAKLREKKKKATTSKKLNQIAERQHSLSMNK